jgi:RHS repeat-associated protein
MQRNGNETMRHNGQPAIGLKMDNLKYNYNTTTTGTGANAVTHLLNNKLRSVNDAVVGNNYTQDIKNHADIDNYTYDKIGNLTADIAGNLKSIEWTLYGKVKKVTKDNGNLITFAYDAAGNRIKKTTEIKGYVTTTYYTRDAQGNVLAVYTNDQDGNNEFYLSEVPLYGSSRLGEWRPRRLLDIVAAENTVTTLSGEKTYELSNHLGNVLAVVSDELSPFGGVGGGEAVVVSATDYYAFGQEMPGRTFASDDYRYGFNGKERENDFWGDGNAYDFGARINDTRLCRWLSVDKAISLYPALSPYNFSGNSPITFKDSDGNLITDPDGNIVYMSLGLYKETIGGTTEFMEYGIIFANDETPILVLKTTKETKQQAELKTDCHGVSFADGKYWINNAQVPIILQAEGYKEKDYDEKKVGDIVVYSTKKDDRIVDSKTISEITEASVLVYGQGGLETENTVKSIDDGWLPSCEGKEEITARIFRKSGEHKKVTQDDVTRLTRVVNEAKDKNKVQDTLKKYLSKDESDLLPKREGKNSPHTTAPSDCRETK